MEDLRRRRVLDAWRDCCRTAAFALVCQALSYPVYSNMFNNDNHKNNDNSEEY